MQEQDTPPSYTQRRGLPRIPVDTHGLPFLGTISSDYTRFEYFLQDVTARGVGIALNQNLSVTSRLKAGLTINTHLPFRLENQIYDQGPIRWVKSNDDQKEWQLGIELIRKVPQVEHQSLSDLDQRSF